MTGQRISTPIDITIPFESVEDNGLVLVHDIGGDPRNYLHSVCVKDTDNKAVAYLVAACYQQNIGFIRDANQWWEYIKPFPLSVADWMAAPRTNGIGYTEHDGC